MNLWELFASRKDYFLTVITPLLLSLTQGQLQLTTKKKELAKNKTSKNNPTTANRGRPGDKVLKIGKNLTKSVNPAGKITLSTKPKTSAMTASSLNKNSPIKKKRNALSPRQPLRYHPYIT